MIQKDKIVNTWTTGQTKSKLIIVSNNLTGISRPEELL